MPTNVRFVRKKGPLARFLLGLGWWWIVIIILVLFALSDTKVFGAERPFVITDDRGGLLHEYQLWSMRVEQSKADVQIRGVCASACTMILRIPAERICVTTGAALQFHLPTPQQNVSNPAFYKIALENGKAMLWQSYPLPIQEWIQRRGGLGTRILNLAGGELRKIYKACESSLAPNRNRFGAFYFS